jgi:hypothetical protein
MVDSPLQCVDALERIKSRSEAKSRTSCDASTDTTIWNRSANGRQFTRSSEDKEAITVFVLVYISVHGESGGAKIAVPHADESAPRSEGKPQELMIDPDEIVGITQHAGVAELP